MNFLRPLPVKPFNIAILTGVVCLLNAFVPASSALATNAQFNQCVANLQSQARRQGISDKTVNEVLGKVKYLARVIELDRRQPEFTQTFAGYFKARVTDDRVRSGRRLIAQHHDLLNKVEQESGIPAKYLVSFWGWKPTTADISATGRCPTRWPRSRAINAAAPFSPKSY